jgi:CheY-like chemotaxis protein
MLHEGSYTCVADHESAHEPAPRTPRPDFLDLQMPGMDGFRTSGQTLRMASNYRAHPNPATSCGLQPAQGFHRAVRLLK